MKPDAPGGPGSAPRRRVGLRQGAGTVGVSEERRGGASRPRPSRRFREGKTKEGRTESAPRVQLGNCPGIPDPMTAVTLEALLITSKGFSNVPGRCFIGRPLQFTFVKGYETTQLLD